eukprot:608047_1
MCHDIGNKSAQRIIIEDCSHRWIAYLKGRTAQNKMNTILDARLLKALKPNWNTIQRQRQMILSIDIKSNIEIPIGRLKSIIEEIDAFNTKSIIVLIQKELLKKKQNNDTDSRQIILSSSDDADSSSSDSTDSSSSANDTDSSSTAYDTDSSSSDDDDDDEGGSESNKEETHERWPELDMTLVNGVYQFPPSE